MTKIVYILALTLTVCAVAVAQNYYDEYGIWHPIDGVTLAAGARRSAGPIDQTRSETYLNFLLTGVAADSLLLRLDVYGMMSDAAADTVYGVLIGSKEEYTADSTIVFADSLVDANAFPFIFVRVTNAHPSDTAVVDFYAFTRPVQKTVLQLR